MGKIKHINEIRDFFKKSPVVGINSLKKIILNNKGNKNYIYLVINNLIKNKKIKKITKSFYTIHKDPTLAVFCFKPAYTGLQDSLSIHNLWDQETNPVIITVKKVRQGVRKALGENILIRRINKKYFFGIEYTKQGKFYIPTSNIEKTFIDMVYYKQNLDKKLIKNFKNKINIKRLKQYLKKYPNKISNKIKKILRIKVNK